MSDLTLNKYVAGFLCGGLLLMAGIKGAEILHPHGSGGHGAHDAHGEHDEKIAKHAYPIEVPESATSVAVATQAPKVAEPILALLANADLGAGEKLSKKCVACHTFNQGGANKVGPNLWAIINATKARSAGFAYSSSLTEKGGAWTYTELNGFLHKPKEWLKGTKMNYVGLKKPKDRANIIAWLRSLASAPAPLPTPDEIATETTNN